MVSTGFWAGCFRRRADVARGSFLRDRFFSAADFLDFFGFLTGAFFAARGFFFLEVLILRAI
jgi:hypothetical protein